MADPRGGPVICHNDVCLENVVFRQGEAVGLLDFDFAAPGRPAGDLASFARMCVPIDDDVNAGKLGWVEPDRPARLRLVADAYGLDRVGRAEMVDFLGATIAQGGAFVRRRVEAGDVNFIKMWDEMGGAERFARRERWWDQHRAGVRGRAGLTLGDDPAGADVDVDGERRPLRDDVGGDGAGAVHGRQRRRVHFDVVVDALMDHRPPGGRPCR